MTPTDPLEAALHRVLREHGADDPVNQGLHSWRCQYPDTYGQGPCDCVELLVHDLAALATPRRTLPGEGVDFTDPDVLSGVTPRPAGVERLATDKAFEELHQRGFLLVPSGYSCSLISDAFIEAYHRLAALTGSEEPARE